MSAVAGDQALSHIDLHRCHAPHAFAAEARRPATNQPRLPPRALLKVREHIETNLDTALELGSLAATAGCSQSHFSRCFRNSTGMTPHAYVVHRRLLRAEELLASTDLGLTEIALITGFSDHSHFTRRFHGSTGLTPRAFRFMHR
jgi:AraC family transcriptional regulator